MTFHLLPPVRIEIRQSKMLKNEVGVFAVRSLRKDSIIVDGKHFSHLRLIKWKNFERFDSVTKLKILDFCPATPEGFFAPADLNYLSIGWHMNHSCNPNVGFNQYDDFVAMRNIKKDEELCWDYGFDETNPKFRMRCHCGQKNCRSVVTGSDWIILMKKKSNYKYFSKQLKQFISHRKDEL